MYIVYVYVCLCLLRRFRSFLANIREYNVSTQSMKTHEYVLYLMCMVYALRDTRDQPSAGAKAKMCTET